MTHEVLNQASPLEDYNLFLRDPVLCAALEREGAGWAREDVAAFGAVCGTAEAIRWGFEANENPPVLHTHDRFGHRRDEVTFHPSYHHLMRLSLNNGLHASPWADPKPGAHAARIAKAYLISQIEAGHFCPVSMTYSAIPALRMQTEVAAAWEPLVLKNAYDPSFRPATGKSGITIGMGMTEKQGGSDVRANTTRAERDGEGYRITGHKWFCSAPMCDAFLILAQAPGGLTCFLLPRWTPDNTSNEIRIQRLKNKLGNRSNASSEMEFARAWAVRIGDEGRGVPAIIEMVNHTRLDCVMGAASIMRAALTQAIHHCRHRKAFGRLLIDQPLMRAVLSELAVEVEAATLLMMRLARAYDEQDRAFARLATAVAKYWVCKRSPVVIAECMECLGGNGYVEDSGLPRLYREAPLNSIWEGSGNVIALDVLRAIRKEPACAEAFSKETGQPVPEGAIAEEDARRVTEQLASALIRTLLAKHSTPQALALFESRTRRTFGTLPLPPIDLERVFNES